jgi:hypothetical protein
MKKSFKLKNKSTLFVLSVFEAQNNYSVTTTAAFFIESSAAVL